MKWACIVAVVGCAGCGGPWGSAGRQYHDPAYQERPQLRASLMKDEKALLSEEAIQTLLSSRIRLPERTKLAVFPFIHRGVHGEEAWGRTYTRPIEFVQAQKAYLSAVEAPLLETERFTEISHLPRFLLPPEPSLTRLREAAALMQAELLLVYRTSSELLTTRGFLFFSDDEVSVNSSMELFLLDVRSGVIPYAETIEAMHVEEESSEDDGILETQRRAEREATLKVIGEAVGGLVAFLK